MAWEARLARIMTVPFLLLLVAIEGGDGKPLMYDSLPLRGEEGSSAVALDGEGNPWVVWEETGGAREVSDSEIYYASWNGHSWGVPKVVAPHPEFWDHTPAIAFDHQGRAWVVWSGSPGTDDRSFVLHQEGATLLTLI